MEGGTTTASLGPAPMVKYGTEPKRRIKKEKKLKKFRDLVKESPVGQVGRTSREEAINHIQSKDVEKKFFAIVKELGGKTVARELLGRLDTKSDVVSKDGDKTLIEKAKNVQEYLRSSGYKIKSEEPTRKGMELEFFNSKDATAALEDLKDAGFIKNYSFTVAGKFLEYIVL